MSDSLPTVLRIVRGVYGERGLLEKTLKNTPGLQQERVRTYMSFLLISIVHNLSLECPISKLKYTFCNSLTGLSDDTLRSRIYFISKYANF